MLAVNFPFLTPQEFSLACKSFVEEVDLQVLKSEWAALDYVEEQQHVYLRIVRLLEKVEHDSFTDTGDISQQDCSDDDDDQVTPLPECRPRPSSHISVIYNICLSPSYRVPVLYFLLKDLAPSAKPTVDKVYEWLVPEVLRLQMKCVGIMGGISYSEHPVTGMPAFFVHPCNTASAMCELARSTSLGLERYLQVWLGLVGGSVGLVMPKNKNLEGKIGKDQREHGDMRPKDCGDRPPGI